MNHEEAMQLALGYAWASEDVSGKLTEASLYFPQGIPSLEFATVFANAWKAFNSERRVYMTPVAEAYRRWQSSRGASIFEANMPGHGPRCPHCLFEARAWAADCEWADDASQLTDAQVVAGITRLYAGGWTQFLKDNS